MQKSAIVLLVCGVIVATLSFSARSANAMMLPAPAALTRAGDSGLTKKIWYRRNYYCPPSYRSYYGYGNYYYARPQRSYRRYYYSYSRPYYEYGYRRYHAPRRYYRSYRYY